MVPFFFYSLSKPLLRLSCLCFRFQARVPAAFSGHAAISGQWRGSILVATTSIFHVERRKLAGSRPLFCLLAPGCQRRILFLSTYNVEMYTESRPAFAGNSFRLYRETSSDATKIYMENRSVAVNVEHGKLVASRPT